jgi:tripartite-type tricarboxylate transporter receptor subunit TctC
MTMSDPRRSSFAKTLLLSLFAIVCVTCTREPRATTPPHWPSHAVRLIAPLAAGGGPDLVARTLSEALAGRWQHPVVVDNRPGGDGVVAAQAVLDAADDHTLLFGPNSIVTANAVLRSLPYGAEDFIPIVSVVDVPIAVVTGASVNGSLPEVLARAQSAPGSMTYTTVFGAPQIVWARLLKDRGIDMPLVGYRNPNVAIPDLIERRVHLALLPLGTTLGPVRSGQLRVLAVLSERRSGVLPDIPTIGEAGLPEYSADGGLGLFAARGHSSDRREWIAGEVQAVLADQSLKDRLRTAGFEILADRPEQYESRLARQRAHLQSAATASR